MNFEFSEHGWKDFQYWIDSDSAIVEKIKKLLYKIKKKNFQGKRKPDRYDLKATGEHRLVKRVVGKKGIDQKCYIIQCRFSLPLKHHMRTST